MNKVHVGLIYGGHSSEHEVSINSARNVFAALDPDRYHVTPILIDQTGHWHIETSTATSLNGASEAARSSSSRALLAPLEAGSEVLTARATHENGTVRLEALGLDVAFPMLHGQNGEDGRIQGMLMMLGIPFVGTGVLGSAVCMDKEVTKRLLRDSGLPVVPFHVARWGKHPSFGEVAEALGTTLFVKPANSGSSVGTSKVESRGEFDRALDEAFAYDHKVLIETAVKGREIECAVLGNEEPKASVIGEIVSTATFYTYDAKYNDPDAARMEVPAGIPAEVSDRARQMATEAYSVLGCEGMARVDFFLTPDNHLYINEVNTIPGFTSRSMYPVMWEHTGMPVGELVDTLIQLALDRHERDAQIRTTR
jgi:D-alanine-D-alanine ligase